MADSQVSGLIEQIKIGSTTHSLASTAYGICDTLAETAAKTVYMTGFNLQKGVTVHIKFTYNNTASSPTLNINNTGAKPIVQYGTTAVANSDSTSGWYAGAVVSFTYDGTSWVRDQGYNTNSTYSYMRPYGSTASGTAAKVGTAGWKFQLDAGKYFMFTQYYDNTAQSALTLNIGGTGAKPIYINGSPSSASNYTLPGGQYLVYYDGTNYHFRTDDKIPGNIAGDAATVNGLTVQTAVPANAVFTDTNKYHKSGSWSGLTYTATAVNSADELKFTIPDNYGDTKNPYASKTKNYVLAAPSSANGAPSFRALVAADIPDLSGTYIKKITSTDNAIVRFDGTGGAVQNSSIKIDDNGHIIIGVAQSIYQNQADSSNYTEIITWLKNSKGWIKEGTTYYTYQPQIGQHNTGGDGTGSITILPYPTDTAPWGGSVGLFIRKGQISLDNNRIPNTGNTTGNVGGATTPVYVDAGVIKAGTALKALAYKDSLVAADIPDLSSTYLKLNGSNNMTADVNIIAGDTDKFINFWYNTGKKAGASWRIGELGSGSQDTNYFVIQSGTSDASGTIWSNALRIGMNTHNVYIPSTTASTSTSTGALTIAGGVGVAGDIYATNLHGNLEVTAHTNTTNGTKNYYPWFSTATSGNLAAKAHSAFYLYETVTDTKISQTDMCVGATNITGSLSLWDGSSHYANIKPTNLSENRSFTLPNAAGTITVGSGSSTDNAIARYDGTLGKLQNSGVIIDDSNNVTIPGTTLKVTAEAGAKYILIGNQNSQGVDCPVILQGVNGSLYIGNGTSWSSNTGGTLSTALFMSKARKIGIGTTNPVTELDVNGTTTALTYKITSNATITYNSTSGCVEIIV